MPHVSVLDLIVLSLAVWRVALLVVHEDGPPWLLDDAAPDGGRLPIGIFAALRTRLALAEMDHPDRWHFFLNGLAGCVWCLSLWLGIVAAALYLAWPDVTVALSLPFALSGLAILYQEQIG